MNKTLCLITGIAPEKIRKGIENAEKHMQKEAAELSVYVEFIHKDMLDKTVKEVLESFWKDPVPLETALTTLPKDILVKRGRVVIIQSYLKDHVFAIMRGIKSVSPRSQDIIFAMVTETASTWTMGYYLRHLKEEHEHMKTHSPEHDSDMRRM